MEWKTYYLPIITKAKALWIYLKQTGKLKWIAHIIIK